jgi:site-specific DNA-methyltransferase (adenine-specific)
MMLFFVDVSLTRFFEVEGTRLFIHHVRFTIDTRNVGDALAMLSTLADDTASLAFYDPQTKANLDHLAFGNLGVGRGRSRVALRQQTLEEIVTIGLELRRVIKPSGYIARWVTPFELGEGLYHIEGMRVAAIQVWDSGRPSYPARIAYAGGFIVYLQRPPFGIRARGLQVQWAKALPGVYREVIRFPRSGHPHRKPVGMTAEIIMAITEVGDTVVDATAGSHTTLAAALGTHRHCWSTDVAPWPPLQAPESARLLLGSADQAL